MILRMLRSTTESGTGPSPLARILAILLLLGLLGATAPVVVPVLRWVLDLL